MTWLRRAWNRVRYHESRRDGLEALQVRVFRTTGGALILVGSEAGYIQMTMPKLQALQFVDTVLDALEEPDETPPAVIQ